MKEKIKKNWLTIFLITVIVFLIVGNFLLYRTQKQNEEILTKRIQAFQEYIQGYTTYGSPFFEIKEQKDNIFIPTGITTKYIKKVYSIKNSEGELEVMIELNKNGAKLFADLTWRNIGSSIGIYIEEIPMSLPDVIEEIKGGKMSLTKLGELTGEEVETFVERIQYETAKNSF